MRSNTPSVSSRRRVFLCSIAIAVCIIPPVYQWNERRCIINAAEYGVCVRRAGSIVPDVCGGVHPYPASTAYIEKNYLGAQVTFEGHETMEVRFRNFHWEPFFEADHIKGVGYN